MTDNWHGGKGSKRRNSNDKAYADNWDLIFGKKEKNGAVATTNKKGKKNESKK